VVSFPQGFPTKTNNVLKTAFCEVQTKLVIIFKEVWEHVHLCGITKAKTWIVIHK